jgi:hypothetical protein
MEYGDLQSLFGSMCTAVLFGWDHTPRSWAHIRGRYLLAKIDDISLWPPAVRSYSTGTAPCSFNTLSMPSPDQVLIQKKYRYQGDSRSSLFHHASGQNLIAQCLNRYGGLIFIWDIGRGRGLSVCWPFLCLFWNQHICFETNWNNPFLAAHF